MKLGLQDLAYGFAGGEAVLAGYIVVGQHTDTRFVDDIAEDPSLFQRGEKLLRIHVRAGDLENDYVGSNLGSVDLDTVDLRELVRHEASLLVILVEPACHFFKRDDAGCGEHTCLSHPSAEESSGAAGLLNEIVVAAKERAHRRAKRLGQAKHYRVETFGEVLGLTA